MKKLKMIMYTMKNSDDRKAQLKNKYFLITSILYRELYKIK